MVLGDAADGGRPAGGRAGRWPTRDLVGARGSATSCCSTRRRWNAASAPAGTRSSSPRPDRLPDPPTGARAPGQGPLHPAAGDGARRRRAGVAAPRAAARTPTTCSGCRSSWPTCTPRCRRCSPGCASGRPDARVAYVMTDGGALPAAFSRTRRRAAGRRLADGVRHRRARRSAATSRRSPCTRRCSRRGYVVRADVAVVAQGPGNLGTGTRWGFSGVAAGEALNAAAVLRGRPVAALRVSGADARERHRGVSHHSLHRLRPGRPGCPRTSSSRSCPATLGALVREQAAAARARRRAATGSSRSGSTGCDAALAASPVPLVDDGPRAWTRTRRPSSPPRPRAGTLRRCSRPGDPMRHDGGVCRGRAASAVRGGPVQRTSTRSTTKMSVSPGLMTSPAPRSP